MLRRAFLAAIVIVLIVVVRLFPDQNQALVDIDLLLTKIEGVRLWWVLAATFSSGALLTFLFAGLLLIKSSLVGRRYRKVIADLEAEVHHLRNLPLAAGELGADFDYSDTNTDSDAVRKRESDLAANPNPKRS